MAYGTTANVKKWLPEIGSADASFDAEIDSIRTDVSLMIDEHLRPFVTVPVTPVPGVISQISEQWSAGEWKSRRQMDGAHDFITRARATLEAYIKSNYGTSDTRKKIFKPTGGLKTKVSNT